VLPFCLPPDISPTPFRNRRRGRKHRQPHLQAALSTKWTDWSGWPFGNEADWAGIFRRFADVLGRTEGISAYSVQHARSAGASFSDCARLWSSDAGITKGALNHLNND